MKTKEELKELKQEYETLQSKLSELSEDELKQVAVGVHIWDIAPKKKDIFDISNQDALSNVTGGVVDQNANINFVAEELDLPTNKN